MERLDGLQKRWTTLSILGDNPGCAKQIVSTRVGIHDSRRDRFESSRDRQPRVGSSCSTKRQGGAILYRGCRLAWRVWVAWADAASRFGRFRPWPAMLFHVVNDRHLKKRPMIFTTNKPLNEWGKVLHDEDMAAAILDRVLERGRFIHLDGPSGRTRHLNLEETLPANTKRLRISGIGGSEFPEPTCLSARGCDFAGAQCRN